jgi:hypothetical protein
LDRPSSSIAKLGFGELRTLLIGSHHVFATLPPDVQPRRSLVRCSPPGCREEPKRKRQRRLASEGPRTSRGLGEESICCIACVSRAGSVGCHWYFLFWTLVGCWPGLLRMCLRGLLLDYLLYNFLYGLDSGRGGHFYFLPGHSWLENTGTRGSCKVVGVS